MDLLLATPRTPVTTSIPTRFRKGRFLDIPAEATWWEKDAHLHRARLLDVARRSTQAIAVLQSAVILHGGSLKHPPRQAHVHTSWHRKPMKTDGPSFFALSPRDRRERLARRPVVNHRMELDEDQLVIIDGIPTTDLLQTMELAARFLAPDDALIALDSLLAIAVARGPHWRDDRLSLEREARVVLTRILHSLEKHRGQRGYRQARELLAVATALAESPFESEMRRIALAAGYSQIESQVEVRTHVGVRWVDLGIPGVRRGIEINGAIKYEGGAGRLQREKEAARRVDLAEVGFTVHDVDASSIADVPQMLKLLGESFPEQRDLHGRPALWTPAERARFR